VPSILESSDPILLSYLVQHLEDEGIPVELRGAPAGTGFSCGGGPTPGSLWVEERHETRARHLVALQMAELAPEPESVVDAAPTPGPWRRLLQGLRRRTRS